MLTGHGFLSVFSLVGPMEFPEVPGSDVQIVLALTTCVSFTEERRWPLGSSSRVSKETGAGSGRNRAFSIWTRRSRKSTNVNA